VELLAKRVHLHTVLDKIQLYMTPYECDCDCE